MEKFLGTIFTIIIVFYLLRIVVRLLYPLLLKLFLKKVEKKMGQQDGSFFFTGADFQNHKQTQAEGDVTVQYTQNKKTNDKGQTISEELGGEYVDFEEVK